MYSASLTSVFSKSLEFGGWGALCRRNDGLARGLCLMLVILIEENGRQALTHMPLHVIGQHAK